MGTPDDIDAAPAGDTAVSRRRAIAGVLSGVLVLTGSACSRTGATAGAGDTDDGAGDADPITPSPTPSTGPTTTRTPATTGAPVARDPEVHLLRRLAYGATESDVEHLRTVGADAWLDEQLEPDALDVDPIEQELLVAAPELGQPAGQVLADYRADGNGARLGAILTIAALVRHTRSPAQLHERLVEFWGDHFNAPQTSPASTIARIAMDRDVLRAHALGRFDELLVATAQSPAMLLYLDNARSRAGAINENYAREVLELHTVGVDGGYDEDDVRAVARLLTGWTITRDLEFRFVPQWHDAGPVAILGWERPPTGDPLEHGEAFLRHLAGRPETAAFVSRKLAVRFVGDDPDGELVESMAAAWIDHDTAIQPVVRAMVEHPAFATAPAKVNRPWDHLVQTLRVLDATVDLGSPLEVRRAYGAVQDLGQVPFRWPGPDGYPDTADAWLNAGGVLARWNVTAATTFGDDVFRTALSDRLGGLRGSTALDVYDHLTRWLRLAEPSTDDVALFTDLTGWRPDEVPTDDDLDETGRLVAFVLLAGPDAHSR